MRRSPGRFSTRYFSVTVRGGALARPCLSLFDVCVCVFCVQHGERIKGATWLAQDPNNTDLILTGGLLSHRAPSTQGLTSPSSPFLFVPNRGGEARQQGVGVRAFPPPCTSLVVPLTLAYYVFVFVFVCVQVQEETHLVERFLVPGKSGASDAYCA